MSTPSKRPPGAGGGPNNRANASPSPSGTTRNTPSATGRAGTGNTAPSTPNGVRRTGSTRSGPNGTPLSARAAAKKPSISSGPSNLSASTSQDDAAIQEAENAKAEAAATIQDLKDRLQKAETENDESKKQSSVLQSRLDEAVQEQGKLEERLHEEEERVEGLENEKRESLRQKRELESIYEAERAQAMKEKDNAQVREEEMHGVIRRLKENIAAAKESKPGGGEEEERGTRSRPASFRASSSPHLDSGHFAPPASLQRSNSQNNSKIVLQKDKVIESLRLELAEAQIKLVEMENMGGGKVQELEKVLLETRMANARLMEDNESFQLLLSEKTLNGDFARGEFMRGSSAEPSSSNNRESGVGASGGLSSLADELENAEDDSTLEPGTENPGRARRLEAEVNALKEENKALSLYINKIIERVLQHQGFENVLDQNSTGKPDAPPPPPPKDNVASAASAFIQRAKSAASRASIAVSSMPTSDTVNPPRARPQSAMPIREATPNSVTNDPLTAPSIPLNRTNSTRTPSANAAHRRSASEFNPASVVNNMYRPSPQPQGSGQISPISPRGSFFGSLPGAVVSPTGSRQPSGTLPPPRESEDASNADEDNARMSALNALEGGASSDVPSPPRSAHSGSEGKGEAIRQSVMTGNKPRPLRMVQQAEDDDKGKKAANRGSWMGWFKREDGPPS